MVLNNFSVVQVMVCLRYRSENLLGCAAKIIIVILLSNCCCLLKCLIFELLVLLEAPFLDLPDLLNFALDPIQFFGFMSIALDRLYL